RSSLTFLSIEEVDSAEASIAKALALAEKNQYFDGIGLAHNGYASVYYRRGKLDEVEKSAKIAVESFSKSKNYYQLAGALNTLGVIYTNNQNFEEALKYFKQSLHYTKLTKSDNISTIYNNIDLTLKTLGRYQEAYNYLDSSFTEATKSYSNRIKTLSNNIEAKFEIERREKDIKILEQENKLKEGRLLKQRWVTALITIFALMLFFLALLLWFFLQLKKKSNKILELKSTFERNKRLELELTNQ